MKKCLLCGDIKFLSDFSKNRRKKDGLQSECKVCRTEINRKWQKENKEKRAAYNKKWRKENPDKANEALKKWQKKNRNKTSQYFKSYYHKSVGNKKKQYARRLASFVPLKSACDLCDTVEDLVRHHYDYDKPKEFLTVCRDCHLIIHINSLVF